MGYVKESSYAKTQLDSPSRFDTILDCERGQTDRHTMTAYTALAQRSENKWPETSQLHLHLWGNNRALRQTNNYWLMISENTVKFCRRNLPDINTSVTGSSRNVLVIGATAVHSSSDNYADTSQHKNCVDWTVGRTSRLRNALQKSEKKSCGGSTRKPSRG